MALTRPAQPSRAAPLGRHARTIRDLVLGRARDYAVRLHRFDEADWQPYARLLAVAFTLAVGRRFRPRLDRAAVIRFVATVRETYTGTGQEIDPALAETLISAALGERPAPPADERVVAAQSLLLIGLLEDEGTTGSALDSFLRLAEDLARTNDPTADTPI